MYKIESVPIFDGDIPLSSPIGTFDFGIGVFETYPSLVALFNKLSNCQSTILEFQNIKTGKK